MRRLQEMKDKSDLFDSKSSEKENQSERDEKPCCDEFKKPWAKRKVGSLVIEGKAHRLYWGSNAIGRTHHNSIQLQSMKVSKRQAVIVATDNKMLIWPISRKSPTCVNSFCLERNGAEFTICSRSHSVTLRGTSGMRRIELRGRIICVRRKKKSPRRLEFDLIFPRAVFEKITLESGFRGRTEIMEINLLSH
ncbi:uncharacterized protein LOC107044301 isoform X1 [Diachasma alloeum]|uniref:uncharacterized protein LOC107044301 isoform X1 n=1 Tax=Diachasma alloeum TaxID=454923 RepID=UPI0007382565|nr:uncharacterized protein LOC107044301 isoform X1 [Diachasma alloeum]